MALSSSNGYAASCGDLNEDTKVNISDAILALRIAVGGQTSTPAQVAVGDLNRDGKIDIADTLIVLQGAVGSRQLTGRDSSSPPPSPRMRRAISTSPT
jgi:hypothetical protein